MRVLVTRPETDAMALKAHLVAQGHDVFIEPLLEVSFEDCDDLCIDEAQCLVATSRNGVRALAQAPDVDLARELPLFVVGAGTAAIAKALGFFNVIAGPGTAAQLVDVIAEGAEVNTGPVVCMSGDHRAFDLPGELQRLGFQVLNPVVYRTVPVAAFTPELRERFAQREIDAVILFSPRTAQTYAELVKKHNVLEVQSKVCHICLSENVAKHLASVGCQRVKVAHRPNLQEILALLTPEGSQSA